MVRLGHRYCDPPSSERCELESVLCKRRKQQARCGTDLLSGLRVTSKRLPSREINARPHGCATARGANFRAQGEESPAPRASPSGAYLSRRPGVRATERTVQVPRITYSTVSKPQPDRLEDAIEMSRQAGKLLGRHGPVCRLMAADTAGEQTGTFVFSVEFESPEKYAAQVAAMDPGHRAEGPDGRGSPAQPRRSACSQRRCPTRSSCPTPTSPAAARSSRSTSRRWPSGGSTVPSTRLTARRLAGDGGGGGRAGLLTCLRRCRERLSGARNRVALGQGTAQSPAAWASDPFGAQMKLVHAQRDVADYIANARLGTAA